MRLVNVVHGLLALLACSPLVLEAQPLWDDWGQFHVVWEDEFDNLDPTNWQWEVTTSGSGNNEFQLYTQDPMNSYTADGILYIQPTLLTSNINPETGKPFGDAFMTNGVLNVTSMYGSCTDTQNSGCYRTGAANTIPPVMSAKLKSAQRFSFKYGRVAISAKMPVGDWLWPAIWMLPEEKVYGGWPVSGEVDIVEARGNRNYKCGTELVGIQKMGSTCHWGPAWNDNHYWKTTKSKHDDNNNFGDNFHNYILDWDAKKGLRFFVDDQAVSLLDVPSPLMDVFPGWTSMWDWGSPWSTDVNPWINGTSLAPFDQNFYLVLNVAVGGTNGYIPETNCVNADGDPNQQKPWLNSDSYNNAIRKFYASRANWQPSWTKEGANNAMQVDYIRVYKRN